MPSQPAISELCPSSGPMESCFLPMRTDSKSPAETGQPSRQATAGGPSQSRGGDPLSSATQVCTTLGLTSKR